MRPRLRVTPSLHRRWIHQDPSHNISTVNSPCVSTIPPSGYSLLSNRCLLAISGPHSTRYLQGAITNNINSNSVNGFYSVFLNAQGRYRGEQGWLVEVDTHEIESLMKRIKRYRLDSKFEIRTVPQTERSVWSVWSDRPNEAKITKVLAQSMNKNCPESVIGCVDNRAPGMGYRLLHPGNKKMEMDFEQFHENHYRVRRYLKGVPEGQNELIKEQALPQESNVDVMGGIDYRKGCYIGQELTIRTHHTGVVRKRILPLQIYGVDEKEPMNLTFSSKKEFGIEDIPPNTSINRREGTGRSTGKWLAGMGNVGLGLCRLASMTEIQVGGEVKSYKTGDEFKVEWESNIGMKTIKVKAFTPAWPLLSKPFP